MSQSIVNYAHHVVHCTPELNITSFNKEKKIAGRERHSNEFYNSLSFDKCLYI